jgi:hypothetical protein
MTVNQARVPASEHERPTMAQMIERLSRFDGPPEKFLLNLLAVQCHLVAAEAGAILRLVPDRGTEIIAVYPPLAGGSAAPVWLAQSAESAPGVAAGGHTAIKALHSPEDMYGQPAGQHLVMLPLRGGSGVPGLASFLVGTGDPKVLSVVQQRLELTVSLLSLYEMRLTLQQRQGDINRLRLAMETTAAVNEQARFAGAAMALCNEVSSRWRCDRVGMGFLKGRYVQLKALSHTEKFSRKMSLVQDIEAAMEETLDQDVEIVYPCRPEATFVSRAAGELGKKHGPSTVLSLPMRRAGQPAAVLTLERGIEDPFTVEEVESLRLACDLTGPRLLEMHESDRWFGARAAAAARKGLSLLLGAKHTWVKLIALLVVAAAVFLIVARGEFRAEGSFTFEARTQQVVPAPFNGYLAHVYVVPGDVVVGAEGGKASWLLREQDVRDWAKVASVLTDASKDPARRVASLMSAAAKQAMARAADPNAAKEQAAVRDDLNRLLVWPGLYDAAAWDADGFTARQADLRRDFSEGRLEGARLVEFNRSLLAAALGEAIKPAPTVLAELETAELRLQLSSAQAEMAGYLKQKDASMAASGQSEEKRAEAQMAQAQADKAAAQIRLLEYRIGQSTLVSAIDGCVTAGDLKRQLRAPVESGNVLFQVASLEDLRAELSMPEDLIADVQQAYEQAQKAGLPLRGELATAARPDRRIGFAVERIDPVAEVVEQQNVFKVHARLDEKLDLLRPGMEGLGKVDIGKRSFAYIWTRKMVNWVRMEMWW